MFVYLSPIIGAVCGNFYQAIGFEATPSERMANRSRSGPAYLSCSSMSEKSLHEDRHIRSKVHMKTHEQSLQGLNKEFISPYIGKGQLLTPQDHPNPSGIAKWIG